MAVLLMGVIKKTSLRHYWSTDPLLQTPFFGTLFSQDRFLLLLRCLHFTNSARVSHHDPLHKIRRIFTAITSSFRRVFVPYKDLCVDESLMKWKGRLAFRQYILTKRSRFGVKFFVLCDVLTGCVQDMVIYTVSTTDICHYEGLGISGSGCNDPSCTLSGKGPRPLCGQLVQQSIAVPAPPLSWHRGLWHCAGQQERNAGFHWKNGERASWMQTEQNTAGGKMAW